MVEIGAEYCSCCSLFVWGYQAAAHWHVVYWLYSDVCKSSNLLHGSSDVQLPCLQPLCKVLLKVLRIYAVAHLKAELLQLELLELDELAASGF